MNAELDRLPEMLARLGLKAMRDRLDNLLDEAGRRDLSLREALSLVCAAEVAHREERRISMGLGIAKFPFVRTLDGFEFDAPRLRLAKFRENDSVDEIHYMRYVTYRHRGQPNPPARTADHPAAGSAIHSTRGQSPDRDE